MKFREVRTEELPTLVKKLEAFLPVTNMLYYGITLGMKHGFIGGDKSSPSTAYLGDGITIRIFIPEEDLKSLIIITTTILYQSQLQMLNGYWELDKLTLAEVREILTSIPSWDWTKNMLIGPCCPVITNQIKEILLSGSFKHDRINRLKICQDNIRTDELVLCRFKRQPHPIPCLPDGYEIREMTKENIEFAINTSDAEMLAFSPIISKYGTLGLFAKSSTKDDSDDQPVSWVLHRASGAISMTHTLRNHRRKGLSSFTTYQLAMQDLQRGIVPFVGIDSTNQPSLDLHEKLGFERTATISITHIRYNK